MSQPMSRVESASVCSEPKSPGGSSVRSAIIIWTGMRLPEIGEYSSSATCTPTPELPVKTRAPQDEAPCAMLNWECSLSATMYSASSSPLATIWASAIIVAVYGRIGYAVITSTSAYFAACAAATHPFIRTVFFFLSITEVAIVSSARSARWRTLRWMSTLILNILRRPVTEISQLFRLPSVQSGGNGECRIHAHHAGIEVQFGHAFQASCWAFLDAHAAAFTVIDQN